jgi:hypothetical protein
MRDNKRRKTKKGGGAGDDRIKNIKEEARQRLPLFNAEASLHTTISQRYHLISIYTQSHAPPIGSAESFLDYLCYYKCMIGCSIICRPPRMCLISCPQQCRAQCGLYGPV